MQATLENFFNEVNEGCGVVVKLPFVTNTPVSFCRSVAELIDALQRKSNQNAQRLDYGMVQPAMKDRKEYKTVCLDGKAKYVAQIKSFVVSPACNVISVKKTHFS